MKKWHHIHLFTIQKVLNTIFYFFYINSIFFHPIEINPNIRRRLERGPDPFANLEPSKFDFEQLKNGLINQNVFANIILPNFDGARDSIWLCRYRKNEELRTVTHTQERIIRPWFDRISRMKPEAIGAMCVFGNGLNWTLSGVWLWRGPQCTIRNLVARDAYEDFDWDFLDPAVGTTEEKVTKYFESDPYGFEDDEGHRFYARSVFH